MFRWIKFFVKLCFLKAAPQDAPKSVIATYLAIFGYWAVGTALLHLHQTFLASVVIAALQTILGVFFINLSLWIVKAPERIFQTVTAFTGSGIIISLVTFPVLSWLAQLGNSIDYIYSIFWVSLVIWETLIVATIFKHALDISMIASFGVALILMFMSFAITLRILKLMSVQLG